MEQKINNMKRILDAYSIEEITREGEFSWSNTFNCLSAKHNDNKKQAIFNFKTSKYECEGCSLSTNKPYELIGAILNKKTIEADLYFEKVTRPLSLEFQPQDYILKPKNFKKYSKAIEELHIFNTHEENDQLLSLPLVINKKLIREIKFAWFDKNQSHTDKGRPKGFVLPYDQWLANKETTFIVSSIQDMVALRDIGINAVTISGGVQDLPEAFYSEFKSKDIVVMYHQNQSIHGKTIAYQILKNTKPQSIKILETEDIETLVDNGRITKESILKSIESLDDLTTIKAENPELTLYEEKNIQSAIKEGYFDKWFKSDVNIAALIEGVKLIPQRANIDIKEDSFCFTQCANNPETAHLIKTEHFDIHKTNIQQINKIIEDKNIIKNDVVYKLQSAGFKLKDAKKDVVYDILEYITLDRAYVVGKGSDKMIFAYFIGCDTIKPGYNYDVIMKIVALEKSVLTAIVKFVRKREDAWKEFKITDGVVESLKKFQVQPNQTIENKMYELWERFKDPKLGGATIPQNIFMCFELSIHSILKFRYPNMPLEAQAQRGVIYNFLVGDPGTGKTLCGKRYTDILDLGEVFDMTKATAKGLLGGTASVNGENRTKLGSIPKHNGSFIVLDESHQAQEEFRREFKKVKSDNRLQIVRVDSTIDIPMIVRSVEIANPRSKRKINGFRHGVEVFNEQFGAANEEFRRIDLFYLTSDDGKWIDEINDAKTIGSGFELEDYKNRVLWIYSRNEHQVKWEEGVTKILAEATKKFVYKYSIHAGIFPKETMHKLSRIAIAMAAITASTNDDFESIYVTQEHAKYTIEYVLGLYRNDLFRIDEALKDEKKYETILPEDKDIFTNIYERHPELIDRLIQDGAEEKRNMQAICNLEISAFQTQFNKLYNNFMIRKVSRTDYGPTPKLKRLHKEYPFVELDLGGNDE